MDRIEERKLRLWTDAKVSKLPGFCNGKFSNNESRLGLENLSDWQSLGVLCEWRLQLERDKLRSKASIGYPPQLWDRVKLTWFSWHVHIRGTMLLELKNHRKGYDQDETKSEFIN